MHACWLVDVRKEMYELKMNASCRYLTCFEEVPVDEQVDFVLLDYDSHLYSEIKVRERNQKEIAS